MNEKIYFLIMFLQSLAVPTDLETHDDAQAHWFLEAVVQIWPSSAPPGEPDATEKPLSTPFLPQYSMKWLTMEHLTGN